MSPHEQYQIDHPFYTYEQDYYVLAAKCALNKNGVCGCGNQCAKDGLSACPENNVLYNPYTKSKVTIKSSGCSPLAAANGDYKNDSEALKQVICDPLKPKNDQCFFEWPEEYKAYTKAITKVCGNAYTWQYHDNNSLDSCANDDNLGFTITIYKRPEGESASSITLHPGEGLAGTIAIADRAPVPFNGPATLRVKIKDGDKVTITDQCPPSNLTCHFTYDKNKGLVGGSGVCADPFGGGFNWALSGKRDLFFGIPNPDACKGGAEGNFTLYPGDGLAGTIAVNDDPAQSFNGPTPTNISVKNGDKVTLIDNCQGGKKMTCAMTYDSAKGLIPPKDGICDNQFVGGIAWPICNEKQLRFGAPAGNACK
ncbi:MAG: hypothetical protein HQK55_08550 [Deltaproteobacteria bacterium]|nr:hypothetical protein [Deltaproteobacteria bacterium]